MTILLRFFFRLMTAFLMALILAAGGCTEKPVIRLAANPWLSSELGAQVAAEILRKELGYQVEIVVVDEQAQWQALASGELDASLEIWPSGHQKEIASLLDRDGGVESLGLLGVVGKIGWYVPTYVIESHPQLASWKGFRDPAVAALFASPDSGGKGRFLAGDPSWVQYDRQIINNLGLPLTVVQLGSEQALVEEVEKAAGERRPVLFYFWFPHPLHAKVPLAEVKLPPYKDQCYAGANKGGVGCAYPPDVLFKIAWPGLRDKAPSVHQFLKNMSLNAQDQLAMMTLVGKGQSPQQAARAWLAANRERWQAWLPIL